jgi:hypothetical protein
MRVNEDTDGWVVIGFERGLRQLAFQLVTEWVPPRWPESRIRSNCTSTSACAMPSRPSWNC